MSTSSHQTIRAGLTTAELRQYAGKWIAFSADGARIVAAAEDLRQLDELVRAAGVDPESVGLDRIEVEDSLLGGAELL